MAELQNSTAIYCRLSSRTAKFDWSALSATVYVCVCGIRNSLLFEPRMRRTMQ